MDIVIGNVLRPMGITRNYRGYQQVIVAIRLVIEDESRLQSITKEVYSRVAEECNCPVLTVERNIRTLIFRAWSVNREYLCEIAGFPLTAPPSVSEFIDIMATYIQQNYLFEALRE